MRNDVRDFLTGLGWLLTAAGASLIAAGLLYALMGWRFGPIVAIWTAQWGLPGVGLGVGLARFGRRGTGFVAVAAGLIATALVLLGALSGAFGSYAVTLIFDGASVAIGVASILVLRRSRRRRIG